MYKSESLLNNRFLHIHKGKEIGSIYCFKCEMLVHMPEVRNVGNTDGKVNKWRSPCITIT